MTDPLVLDTRKPVEERRVVKINDETYIVLGLTRRVAQRLQEVGKRSQALQDDPESADPDAVAVALIDALGARLRNVNPDGEPADTLLHRLWESEDDELSLEQLFKLREVLETRFEELDRPPR